MEIFTKNSAKCTVFQSTICNKFSSLMWLHTTGAMRATQHSLVASLYMKQEAITSDPAGQ
jgi:hypothetical protein